LGLGVLADIAGVLTYIGLNIGMGLLVLAPICYLITIITKDDPGLII
jgi:hypothetical protein